METSTLQKSEVRRNESQRASLQALLRKMNAASNVYMVEYLVLASVDRSPVLYKMIMPFLTISTLA